MGHFDSNEIVNLLQLLNIHFFNLQVVSPIFKQQEIIPLTTDPIYGTEFSIEKISSELLTFWDQSPLNPMLQLPSPNEFIPQDFELKPIKVKKTKSLSSCMMTTEVPEVIFKKDDQLKVWHLQDSKYLIPKAFIAVFFKRFVIVIL